MSKPVKNLISQEFHQRFSEIDSVIVVNPIKLTGVEGNAFRRSLWAKHIQMTLVKNSLLKRSVSGTKLDGVCDLLNGPSALVTGGESIVDAARELDEWMTKLPSLEVLGAVVDGQPLDAKGAAALAKMPTRRELQGQIVQLMQSPGARVASLISSPASRVAGCIKALIETLESSEGSEAA